MSYVIKSCFRLSSIAAVHLRKSWTSLAPMTPRIKPGSHRELIFQEVHNQFRKNSISGCGMLAENHMPGLLSAKHISVCHTLSNICHTDFIASCKWQFSISPSIYFSSATSTSVIIPAKVTSDLVCMICGEYFVGFAAKAVCSEIF